MFNWLDVVIVLVVASSAGFGAYRGFIREFFSLIGWVGGILLAVLWHQPLADWFAQHGLSHMLIAEVLAFISLTCAVVVVSSALSFLIASRIEESYLRSLDRLLGAIFGGIRGIIIMALLAMLLMKTRFISEEWYNQSLFTSYLVSVGDSLQVWFPQLYEWTKDVLGRNIGAGHGEVLAKELG